MGELGSGCPGRAGGGGKERDLVRESFHVGAFRLCRTRALGRWGARASPALPQLTSHDAAGAAVGPDTLLACVPLAFKSLFPGQMPHPLDGGRIRSTQRLVLSWVCDG